MKIVINASYGCFALSRPAVLRYAALKGMTLFPESHIEHTTWWLASPYERPPILSLDPEQLSFQDWERYVDARDDYTFDPYLIERDDPHLVQLVEEMGKSADGLNASLKVIDIPDGITYRIMEADGREWVAEDHRVWS